MATYTDARDADTKAVVWILELPSSKRYVSSRPYGLTSSDATPGLVILSDLETKLGLRTGNISFGELEVLIIDEDGSFATYLSSNDTTLKESSATLKYGFSDVSEANFQTLSLLFDDWRRIPDGFVLTLRSALSALNRPLFDDIQNDNFTLRSDYPMSINGARIRGDLEEAGWRSTGEVLFVDQNTGEVELFSYTEIRPVAFDHTRITGNSQGALTRQVHSVGATGKTWTNGTTAAHRCWAYSENPITLFLQMITTTEAGTNGTWDNGDGDGLGIDVDLVDHATFVALRDARMLDDTGTARAGVYVGIDPIESVYEFWRDEFLALGFRLGVTADAKITLRRHPNLTATTSDINGKFILDAVPAWERRWNDVENNIRLSYGWNPGSDGYYVNLDRTHARSQTRYGKSRQRKLESRGTYGRTARGWGWPDLGWDDYMARRASEYLMEFCNPSQDIRIPGFLMLQDAVVGDLVTLTHPGIYDLDNGVMGVTDQPFYVTAFEREPERGQVQLSLQQRRQIGRPAYIAPNATTTYGAASEADKQYGFISPTGGGSFSDGGASYEVGT